MEGIDAIVYGYIGGHVERRKHRERHSFVEIGKKGFYRASSARVGFFHGNVESTPSVVIEGTNTMSLIEENSGKTRAFSLTY